MFITFNARLVSVISDNYDAAEEEGIELNADSYEARAYYAMQADVWELLNNEYFREEMHEKMPQHPEV